ncbi:MAG: J domain-containing protein [Acidobacteria bacterium]|nr:J domain-containing protein [Acidobacteriota bacterium]
MQITSSENPYKVLGLERNATAAQIKQAYFGLVREHSPESDPEGFKRIRAAYEKLRDSKDRAQTDIFTVDDTPLVLPLAAIQTSAAPLPPLTLAEMKADLLAVEALTLLDELTTAAAARPPNHQLLD